MFARIFNFFNSQNPTSWLNKVFMFLYPAPFVVCVISYSLVNYWKRFFFLMLHIHSFAHLNYDFVCFIFSRILFNDDLLVNRLFWLTAPLKRIIFWKQGSSSLSLRLIFEMKFTECAGKDFYCKPQWQLLSTIYHVLNQTFDSIIKTLLCTLC